MHYCFFLLVMSAGSLGMLHTTSQYSLYLHLYLTIMLIHVLAASSFVFLHDCCAAAAVSVSVIENEFLFFYLSLQEHQSLLVHFVLASIASCSGQLLPTCVTSPVLYIPLVPIGVHPHVLLPVCLLWKCTLAHSLKCW